jgi:hypothetical protein
MMWGMGLVWLIVIVVLALAIAALVKYVFFSSVIALERSRSHRSLRGLRPKVRCAMAAARLPRYNVMP